MKSPLRLNALAASAGNGVFLAASFARTLVLANLIGPVQFGAWNLGLVWLQYGQWSHGTLLNAFRLSGARARGAGDLARFNWLRRLAWTASVLPAGLVTLVVMATVPFVQDAGHRQAWLILAALLVPFQLYTYVTSALTTEERFPSAARVQVLQTLLTLTLLIPLAIKWGFGGAVAAQALGYLLACVGRRHDAPLISTPVADRRLIAEQLRIGLPVGLNGMVSTAFMTLDRTMVASSLGVAALGQYALTAIARSSIGLVPNAMSEVVYMRTSTQYGESESVGALLPLILKADRAVALVIAPVIGMAAIWTGLGVSVLLPRYVGGVAAVQVYLVGLFFMFPQFAGVLLTSIGRASRLLSLQVVAVGVEAFAIVVALRWIGSLESVAAATGLASAFLFFAVNFGGLRVAGLRTREIGRHLGRILAPFAAMTAGVGVGRWVVGIAGASPSTVSAAAIQSLVFLALNALVLRAAVKLFRSGLARS